MLTGGRARVTALLGALAMVASACSGTADQGQGLNSHLQGQELEVVAVWSGEEQASFEQVLRRFESRTGAKVRFTSTGRNMATALGHRLRAGDAPDVAILPQPGLLAELARQRELAPVEAVAGTLVDENYAPVWRELGSVDGILYGVWFKAANKSTVWYRTKAFFDAGVAPPRTWQKLRDVSRRLDEKGITPLALGAGDGWTLTDWFENVYLRTAGPARYDELANRQIPWTHDSVREALRTLGQVLGRHEWLLGGAEGALATSFEGSVVQTFGQPAMAAMTFEGSFVATNIAKETRAEVGTDARFFQFPSINESERSVIFGGDVAVLLGESQASRELIRFLATPEAAEPWAEAGGFISPNRSVDPAAYPDLTTRELARALTQPGVVRFDLSDLVPASFGATHGQGMWRILQDWLKNPADVDATAAQLEAAAAAAQP